VVVLTRVGLVVLEIVPISVQRIVHVPPEGRGLKPRELAGRSRELPQGSDRVKAGRRERVVHVVEGDDQRYSS
jgi:hypothetical protein